MKINLRQEIAMWVLGLLWTGLGLTALIEEGTVGETVGTALGTFLPLLVLLVPIFLIIFSLRDRARRD
jgi:hypothetical protein